MSSIPDMSQQTAPPASSHVPGMPVASEQLQPLPIPSHTHEHNHVPFEQRVDEALDDDRLQGAVRLATERLSTGYQRVKAGTPEFMTLRHRAAEIRRQTLEHLDEHLARLADQLTARGGSIYFADDAAAARNYVVQVAQRHGVRMLVKSKSMISEEIKLNAALQAAGIEPVETDLGEFIIQLAGEEPSHIIIPALHKTRGQVAELFSRLTGEPLSDEPAELAALARRLLRQRFLSADMGVSGVNFAIAETGTIALVSNEGNGRMSTSLPRVHVALMGMERVAPTWDDLAVLMRVLPPAATGQVITTYLSLLSGPRRVDEPDGPDEVHLVVLDNGRSKILGSEFQDILRCIRCGACLNVCPIYRNIGGHAYGATYPGPVGAVLDPLLMGDEARELPYASSLCGACTEACPVEIPLHDLLIKHRARDIASHNDTPLQNVAFGLLGQTWSNPATFRASTTVGSAMLRLISGGRRWIKQLPGPGAAWTQERDFPVPPGEPFHKRWARLSADDDERSSTSGENSGPTDGPGEGSKHDA